VLFIKVNVLSTVVLDPDNTNEKSTNFVV